MKKIVSIVCALTIISGVFAQKLDRSKKPAAGAAPEIKLFFMISGSAVKFHLTNMAMNSLPNLGEMMNKNPSLADKLRQQAAADKVRNQQ